MLGHHTRILLSRQHHGEVFSHANLDASTFTQQYNCCNNLSVMTPFPNIHTCTDKPGERQYPYTQQLLSLGKNYPQHTKILPEELYQINSPVRLSVWQEELARHPDQAFAQYIIQGLSQGFRIGYQHKTSSLKPAKYNILSASQHPDVVSSYLHEELRLNRVVRMSTREAEDLGIHCSPFRVIPKKHKPGRWRLIVDLSSPPGTRVNNGIDKEMCSMSYTSVDIVAAQVQYTHRTGLC